jgi:hypothetical protein
VTDEELVALVIKDKKYFADFIVELRLFPIKKNTTWVFMPKEGDLYNDPFYDFFLKSGDYEVILDREVYRILAKRSSI